MCKTCTFCEQISTENVQKKATLQGLVTFGLKTCKMCTFCVKMQVRWRLKQAPKLVLWALNLVRTMSQPPRLRTSICGLGNRRESTRTWHPQLVEASVSRTGFGLRSVLTRPDCAANADQNRRWPLGCDWPDSGLVWPEMRPKSGCRCWFLSAVDADSAALIWPESAEECCESAADSAAPRLAFRLPKLSWSGSESACRPLICLLKLCWSVTISAAFQRLRRRLLAWI